MSDLNKKVSFQTGEKESRKEDDNENIDIVMIYENCSAERRTAPKSQDNTADYQQQATSVSVSPVKRNLLVAAAVSVGPLCLVLLFAIRVVLVIQDKDNCNRLWEDNGLLQSNYSEMKSINQNLTRTMTQLENDKNLLKAVNNNLTIERDELQTQLKTHYCPDYWISFGKSCYLISNKKQPTINQMKTWTDSKKFCEDRGAHLVIISNEKEQKFISSFNLQVWIGLTDEETEGVWKWVDGTEVTETYWGINQPDNHEPAENCVVIVTRGTYLNNWNDLSCSASSHFICEINLSILK